MKCLWIAHAIPYPPKAGFLLRSYNLLRELSRSHTVDLTAFIQERWITRLFPNFDLGIEECRHALGEFCRTVTFLPIDTLRLPLGKPVTALRALLAGSSYTTTWLASKHAYEVIARQLDESAYDLVHFDTIGLVHYRPLVNSIPTTLNHHNIESHMMFRRADNAENIMARAYFRHEARALRNAERRTASQFVTHITCSDLDAVRLREFAPGVNVRTIPNGVDCEYFTPQGIPARPKSIVFVGTMDWYPNVDAMVFFLSEIWPALKTREPGATLDVAGSNPPPNLIRLAHSLEDVTIHGYISDVRPLIDSAELVICPIRDGGGTKLKILDAFAMCKCVVAHPIACEGIDITPGQNVVFARTPTEFIDSILSLFADSNRRDAIGRAARALVERQYSFSIIGSRFRSLMESVAYQFARSN